MTDSLYAFLDELAKRNLYFTLASHREKSVMVTVYVPGERWECEYFEDGSVEVEIFKSDGNIWGKESIGMLFEKHSDS